MPDLLLPRRLFLGWTAALAGSSLFARPAVALPSNLRLVDGVFYGTGGDLNAAIAALPDGAVFLSLPDVSWFADGGLRVVGKRGVRIDLGAAGPITCRVQMGDSLLDIDACSQVVIASPHLRGRYGNVRPLEY